MPLDTEVQLRMILTATNQASDVIAGLMDSIAKLKVQLASLAEANPFADIEEAAGAAGDAIVEAADRAKKAWQGFTASGTGFAQVREQAAAAATSVNGIADAAKATGAAVGSTVKVMGASLSSFSAEAQAKILAAMQESGSSVSEFATTAKEAFNGTAQALQNGFATATAAAKSDLQALGDQIAALKAQGQAVLASIGGTPFTDLSPSNPISFAPPAAVPSFGQAAGALGKGVSSLGHSALMTGMNLWMGSMALQMLAQSGMGMATIQQVMQLGNFTPAQAEQMIGMLGTIGIAPSSAAQTLQNLSGGLQKLFMPSPGTGMLSKEAIMAESFGVGPQIVTETVGQQIETIAKAYQNLLSQGRGGDAATLLSVLGAGAPELAPLLQNYGTISSQFKGFDLGLSAEQIKQAANSALDMQAALTKLGMQFSALASATLPAFTAAISNVTGFIQRLTGHEPQPGGGGPKPSGGGGLGAVGIEGVLGVLGLGWVINAARWAKNTFGPSVKLIGGLLGRLGPRLAPLVAPAEGVAEGAGAAAAGPFALLAAGAALSIGSAIPGVSQKLDKLFAPAQKALDQYMQQFQDATTRLGNSITTWTQQQESAFANWVSGVGASVGEWVSNTATWAGQQSGSFLQWISNVSGSVGQWGASVLSWASQQASAFLQWIASVGSSVGQWASGVVQWIGQQAAAFARWIAGGADAVGKLASAVGDWIAKQADAFGKWIAGGTDAVGRFVSSVAEWVGRMADGIGKWIAGIVTAIGNAVPQLVQTAGTMVQRFVDAIGAAISDIRGLMSVAEQFAQNLLNSLRTAIDGIYNDIRNAIGNLFHNAVAGVEEGAVGALGGMLGAISQIPVIGGVASGAAAEADFMQAMLQTFQGNVPSGGRMSETISGPGNTTINITIPAAISPDQRTLAEQVARQIVQNLKLKGNVDLSF